METDSRPLLEDSSNGANSTEQARSSAHLDEAAKISQQQKLVDVQGTGLFHSPILASSSSSTVDGPSSSKSKLAFDEPPQRSVIDTVSTNLDSFVLPVAKNGSTEENIPIDVQKHLETHIMSEQSDSGDLSAPKSPALAGAASLNLSDSPPCGSQPPQDGTPSEQASAGWTPDGVFVPMYSRKEKSLGLLCDNFLRLFSNEQETWGGVCLDSAAKKLHVERRRIYDIVNVLESVEIVARRAKNKYAWFGMTRLPQAIERLRTATLAELNTEPAERQAAEAELDARTASQGFQGSRNPESDKTEGVAKETLNPSSHDVVGHSTALESAGLIAPSVVEVNVRNVLHPNSTNGSLQNEAEPCSTEDEAELAKLAPPMSAVASSASAATGVNTVTTALPAAVQEEDLIYGVTRETYNQFLEMYRMAKASRKEKSLGVLSQKFVQLFLNSEHGVVSLEPAARKLLEEDTFNDESQLKTKIRRLYDIANILCSLNLIEKTSSSELHRKPAFKWIYDPTKLDHRFRNVGPFDISLKPTTPVKTTPKPEKPPKEPKPAKQPREAKPPKEKKEKVRKSRKLDTELNGASAASQLQADPQAASDLTSLPLFADIFQQLPYLQSLLQFSAVNPVSAQAIIQGNPAIMAMLANPVLMNLLAMSNSYVNSFMSASAVPNFGLPDSMPQYAASGGMAAPMGVAPSPFYVPPVDPSVLTQFMLSPDFSSFNASLGPSVANPNPPTGQDAAPSLVKQEQNYDASHMS